MAFILTKQEKEKINQLIESFEEKTHSELFIVLAKRSDPYPAAALRFGVSMALSLTFLLSIFVEFKFLFLYPVITALSFFIFSFIGRFRFIQKWILTQNEVDREVREKAYESFFLFGPNKANHKASSMIFFSILEQKFHIIVDHTMFTKMEQNDLNKIKTILENDFSHEQFYDGFETAIETLERLMTHYFPNKVLEHKPNELPNTIIQF